MRLDELAQEARVVVAQVRTFANAVNGRVKGIADNHA